LAGVSKILAIPFGDPNRSLECVMEIFDIVDKVVCVDIIPIYKDSDLSTKGWDNKPKDARRAIKSTVQDPLQIVRKS